MSAGSELTPRAAGFCCTRKRPPNGAPGWSAITRPPMAWLVSWKQAAGKPFIAYPDSVDEALCFGWVDSRPNNRLDDRRSMHLFTPRNPKSPWSRINKEKAARLAEQGRMADAGIRSVEAAQADGAWTVYDEIEDPVMPDDLSSALSAAETARAFFDNFPVSSRKNTLWWIKSARTTRTQDRRIRQAVDLAASNRMANHPRGRDRGRPRPSRPAGD